MRVRAPGGLIPCRKICGMNTRHFLSENGLETGSASWKKILFDGAGSMGVQLSSHTVEQFAIHAAELEKWNQKTNLTAIRNPVEVAEKHFLDAIAPLAYSLIPQGAALLDIGSGGGFPGIPLKLLMPSLSVVLLDASRKKASFLRYVIHLLELQGIEAVHSRAETLKVSEFGDGSGFDVVICRAFSDLMNFFHVGMPLTGPGGKMLAMKSKKAEQEIRRLNSLITKARPKYPFVDLRTLNYRLPFSGAERSLIILDRKRV